MSTGSRRISTREFAMLEDRAARGVKLCEWLHLTRQNLNQVWCRGQRLLRNWILWMKSARREEVST